MAGDSKNRSGGPLDSSVGCTGHDLSIMGDGEIKKRLEDVARIAKEIQDPVFLEAMANMGQQVTPPSQSHVLVMEATIILLMPRTVYHNHIPFSSLRGVTWREARHILGYPDKLCAALLRVDACNIPPVNLSTLQASKWQIVWSTLFASHVCSEFNRRPATRSDKVGVPSLLRSLFCLNLLRRHHDDSQVYFNLGQRQSDDFEILHNPHRSRSSPSLVFHCSQVYIGHDRWPRSGVASIGDGGLLEILATWARSIVEISVLLARAGGNPEALCQYSKAHVGLLAAVVPVHDEYFSTKWDSNTSFKRG